MNSELNIHSFDIRNANEKEYRARNDFNNRMRFERFAEDTVVTLDEEVRGWRAMPDTVVGRWFNAWDAGENELVAVAYTSYFRADENQHIANFDIAVSPAHRRSGIALELLAHLAPFAREHGKRLMMCWSSSLIPAGEAFLRGMGAELAQPMHTSDLELAELDHGLMRQWIEPGEQNGEFELGMWRGAIPEQDIEPVCKLIDVMNTMPRDELDMEDWHLTPEQMRSWEHVMAARGDERWLLFARHRSSGELAGFTELFWNANRPHRAEQGGTGVWPHFRNHGLGRWLKAEMIERVLAERPQVAHVRTGNAHSNAPMLKINAEMGFKAHHSEYRWQVATDKLFEYLARREPAIALT